MLQWVRCIRGSWFAVGILVVASACGSSRAGSSMLATAGEAGWAGYAGAGAMAGTDAALNGAGSQVTGQGGNRFDTSNVTTVIAADDPALAARYQACVTYIRAQCQRRATDCGERFVTEDPCAQSLDRCPDVTFSPGSTWTIESLLSCAEEWKSFSCDDVRQNKRPACASAKGTHQVGEPCLFAHQCVTGSCSKANKDGTKIPGYDNCGVCGEVLALGENCIRSGYDCSTELSCNISTGKCEAKPVLGIVGNTCNDDSTCGGYGISCRTDPADGVKRCLAYAAAGESCANAPCADGFLCSSSKTCTSAPGLNETCGSKGPAQCAVGLVCSGHFDAVSNACVQPRQLGENCLGDARRVPRGSCATGLRCDCGAPDCDLKSGICRQSRNIGEDCTDKNSVCVPGTTCTNGKCTAVQLQTALVELCP